MSGRREEGQAAAILGAKFSSRSKYPGAAAGSRARMVCPAPCTPPLILIHNVAGLTATCRLTAEERSDILRPSNRAAEMVLAVDILVLEEIAGLHHFC